VNRFTEVLVLGVVVVLAIVTIVLLYP